MNTTEFRSHILEVTKKNAQRVWGTPEIAVKGWLRSEAKQLGVELPKDSLRRLVKEVDALACDTLRAKQNAMWSQRAQQYEAANGEDKQRLHMEWYGHPIPDNSSQTKYFDDDKDEHHELSINKTPQTR